MFKFDVEIGRFAEEARALLSEEPVVVTLQEGGWLQCLAGLQQQDPAMWHPLLELSTGRADHLAAARGEERDWSGLVELWSGSARRVVFRRFAMVGGRGNAFTATIATTIAASTHREHIDAALSSSAPRCGRCSAAERRPPKTRARSTRPWCGIARAARADPEHGQPIVRPIVDHVDDERASAGFAAAGEAMGRVAAARGRG